MFGEISHETTTTGTAPGILTIDLGAVAGNYRLLTKLAGGARVAGVVKANAYGLGARRVVPALYGAGCRDFFVAHFDEARAIRDVMAGDARIHVLNGLLPGVEAACAAAGVIPVLNSLDQLGNWQRQASGDGPGLPALLQLDTGMSRLGLSPQEVETLLAEPWRLEGVRLLYVMSHLASADDPESGQNAEQLAAMQRLAAAFPGVAVSFANSGGIFLGGAYHGALARPGIALYGGAATAAGPNRMTPVVRLDARVLQTRTVPGGARVGYGAAHVTVGERRLATLAVGYADGLPRALGDRGAAYLGDVRLPIVGRVSMDSMTVDITALPAGALELGSLVEIVGPHQSLEDVARDAGTIAYEILTSLGGRYHRVYL